MILVAFQNFVALFFFSSKLDLDDGRRDIARLQEMLLPDGDLTAEGQGRMRRFRWRNIGKIEYSVII